MAVLKVRARPAGPDSGERTPQGGPSLHVRRSHDDATSIRACASGGAVSAGDLWLAFAIANRCRVYVASAGDGSRRIEGVAARSGAVVRCGGGGTGSLRGCDGRDRLAAGRGLPSSREREREQREGGRRQRYVVPVIWTRSSWRCAVPPGGGWHLPQAAARSRLVRTRASLASTCEAAILSGRSVARA